MNPIKLILKRKDCDPINYKKINIQIRSWLNGSVLFEYESVDNTIAKTVEVAVERSADLSYANLSSANLSYANLSSANLRYANLSSANLRYANLVTQPEFRQPEFRQPEFRRPEFRRPAFRHKSTEILFYRFIFIT